MSPRFFCELLAARMSFMRSWLGVTSSGAGSTLGSRTKRFRSKQHKLRCASSLAADTHAYMHMKQISMFQCQCVHCQSEMKCLLDTLIWKYISFVTCCRYLSNFTNFNLLQLLPIIHTVGDLLIWWIWIHAYVLWLNSFEIGKYNIHAWIVSYATSV